MSDGSKQLTYDLGGYDYRGASQMLLRRLLPAHQRHSYLILLAFPFVFLGMRAIAEFGGLSLPPVFGLLLFLAAWMVWVFIGNRRRERVWAAVSDVPGRRGPMRVVANDEGLTLTSMGAHSTLFWSGILDVVEGKDGLLVLIGPLEFAPIPARAFKDAAEQKAVLADLKAHLARAKGTAA